MQVKLACCFLGGCNRSKARVKGKGQRVENIANHGWTSTCRPHLQHKVHSPTCMDHFQMKLKANWSLRTREKKGEKLICGLIPVSWLPLVQVHPSCIPWHPRGRHWEVRAHVLGVAL